MSCPPHPADLVEVRKRRAVGGGTIYQLQCGACLARVGPELVPAEHPLMRLSAVRPFMRRGRPNSKKRAYEKYLRSPSWKQLRRLVLERDRHICQDCGAPATDVAHRTYDRFGDERLGDLKASCRDCNKEERERRIRRRVLG